MCAMPCHATPRHGTITRSEEEKQMEKRRRRRAAAPTAKLSFLDDLQDEEEEDEEEVGDGDGEREKGREEDRGTRGV
ncbi:unnamed protein product [Closterium sp. NIES-54]